MTTSPRLTTSPSAPTPTALLSSPFLERLLRFLIPYFTGVTADLRAARAEALETLASYGARTRAEMLSAVQIIVFSLAALETLDEAQTAEMSPALRLRFRGCANNLNRSSQKTEQTLAKRLACDVPDSLGQEPVDDLPDHQAQELLQQTQAAIEAHRSRLPGDRVSGDRPAHSPQPKPQFQPAQSQADHNKRLWASAMMQTLAGMGMPVQPVPPADKADDQR